MHYSQVEYHWLNPRLSAEAANIEEEAIEEDPTNPTLPIPVLVMFPKDMQTVTYELKLYTNQQKLRERTLDKKLSSLKEEMFVTKGLQRVGNMKVMEFK